MKLPTILSVAEVERLIMVTTNLKHRALLALAYSAGLRREETQKIKPGHIDSERMRVLVEDGKCKKSRHTLLAQKTLDLLRIYFMTENAIMELVCPIQTFFMNVISYINWKLIIHKPKSYRFTKFYQMQVKGCP